MLSDSDVKRLETAVTSKAVGRRLADAIDALGDGPAAVVAAIGTTSNLSALVVTATTFSGAACTGGSTPTATNVNTAIDAATAATKTALDLKADNADVETLRTQVEARLDAVEAKADELIAALKAVGIMASS